MLLESVIEKMKEVANAAASRLEEHGLTAKVELDYMNAFLKTVEDKKRARFVTVSVVISAPETPEGDEYCLSLGAEVRGGRVDDGQLEKDISSFGEMVDETIERLSTYESKAEGVSVLAGEASAEYDKLVTKLTEDQKRQRLLSAIGMSLTIIGVVVLFIVATLG